MKPSLLAFAFLVLSASAHAADDAKPFRVPDAEDYAPAMKKVAAKFKGTPGVFLHLGDSNTYANQATAWARGGMEQTDAEKAFLKWSHAGKRDESDGWYLASTDVPSNRSHTAASGMQADEFLKGGKGGLPALADVANKYKPQLALYMLGTNDVRAGRPTAQYIADVEKAVDLLLDQGTVVILSTLPPYRGKAKIIDDYNKALRQLAAAKHVPIIDLHGEMKARGGDDFEKQYLGDDDIHLSQQPANGPATDENLKKCGYLLRCYLAVHKGMEVKKRVFDAK